MDIIIAFAAFLGSMALCLALDQSVLISLVIGWLGFLGAAMHRGCKLKALLRVSFEEIREALVVMEIMLIIGMLTAAWRSGGTILFFVYYGIKLISPGFFILISFVLCAVLSYAIGTSFGVVSTIGVIFMAIARSGGANLTLTAGAVMSGIYFGDCCSPAASSMALTASLCHTDAYAHSVRLLKANLLPAAMCLVIYGALSTLYPLEYVDTELMDTIRAEFDVSWYVAIPAVIMLLLPVFKVKAKLAMLLSICAAGLVSIRSQGMPVWDFLKCLALGYRAESAGLDPILQGGGIVSMLDICAMLVVSSTYSGIFRLSGLLDGLSRFLAEKMRKVGAFPVTLVSGIVFGAVFCNQTIAILMCASMLEQSYEKLGLSSERFALDIGCTAVDLCGLIPWCLACMVPLNMMNAGLSALPFACLLYLLPLTCLVRDRVKHKRERPALQ